MNEERKARLLLLFVVILWGLNVVMVKYLSAYFNPTMLGAWRIGAAAVLLTALVWKQYGFVKISWREWGTITGIAVSGIFLHQITLSAGVKTTEASTASLILGLNPLVTMVLAYFLFREPLTVRKVGGVLLGFCGVFLVVFGNSWEQSAGLHFGVGEWLIVVAMLTYVISGMFIKKATQTVPVMVVTAYSHIIATLLLVIAATGQQLVSDAPFTLSSDWFVWGVLLFSAFFATGYGSVWWNSGIRIIGAGRTAMYINGMPMLSLIFSVLLLGESITWIHIFGFSTVFVAILLGTSKSKAERQLLNQSV
ncbi:DMT family transporter [Tumebacillus permanentifrigoris]|uniref:EamA domain-containing membrane protein RarD n=1 Tax=Tumebacillus permanentifrigoris TaxID=378543 RepID=A0A316DTR5_9BACL|nr:DMT family transporter [Tumebacillus permanentifrigoris]PWK11281.1 EamA domain-containing membrane protein RarD [Tumebacillus permanentifrigoris]